MRGKSKIWTLTLLTLLLGASLMLSSPSVKAQWPLPLRTVSVVDPEDGNREFRLLPPGTEFQVSIECGRVTGVRGIEFTLKWDPTILDNIDVEDPLDARVLGRNIAGPFLTMGEIVTDDPVARKGVAGDRITFNNHIVEENEYVDGSSLDYGPFAVLTFRVIGGGKTDLSLTGKLVDKSFKPVPYTVTWRGGLFWNDYPHIAFTWRVPTARNATPMDEVSVNGTDFIRIVDEDGDIDYISGPVYTKLRPLLNLDDTTGEPDIVEPVEGGTMFYGDEIIFDASNSYDLNNMGQPAPLNPSAFKWVIRNAGMNNFTYRDTTYDTRYESGKELPYGPKFSYVFPGKGGSPGDVADNYKIYSLILGFHDLNLTVTDADGKVAIYHTWIRIYRLSPARLVMLKVPSKHFLSKSGYQLTLGGKVQNRGGTSIFPYDFVALYLELARMIHAAMWIRIQFDISDEAGVPVTTLYSDALWLDRTEIPLDPMALHATWTMPSDILPPGVSSRTFNVEATAWFCGSGVTYGLKATGVQMGSFKVLP